MAAADAGAGAPQKRAIGATARSRRAAAKHRNAGKTIISLIPPGYLGYHEKVTSMSSPVTGFDAP